MNDEVKAEGVDRLFDLLCKATRNAEISKRVTNHIRAVSGHNTLVTYHQNGAKNAQKAQVYKDCLIAIKSGEWAKLQGQMAGGQAVAPEPEPEEPKPAPRARQPKEVIVQPKQDEKLEVEFAPEPERADPARKLAEALREMMPSQRITLDDAKVQEIVTNRMGDLRITLAEELQARVDNYLKAIPPREVVEIRPLAGEKFDIPRQHYKFPLLMACLAQRIPVCLVGPAASSKSTAAKFAAEALKLPFGASNFGPTTSKSDLFGFKDANGHFHQTELVRTALNGGVWCGDEFDRGHAGVSTMLNMPLANRIIPLPEGTKPVHDDWVPVLTANTYGTGANRLYVGANQMDAATLDRMAFIEWDYDTGLEGALIGVEMTSEEFRLDEGGSLDPRRWMDAVCRTRQAVAKLGIRHLVTPRASIYGAKLLAAGVGLAHVEAIILWKGLDAESVRKVKENL